jgi:ParB-like chromosome segregation protein Spo0J
MNDEQSKMVDISKLIPWAKNPRKNDQAIDAVAESIQRFGFASPILARVEDGRVIAGHTRLKAAQRLGIKQVPVRYLALDDREADALALADNRLGELAEWDDVALAEILAGLDTDAKGLGWSDDDIAAMLENASKNDKKGDDVDRRSLADRFGVPPFSVLDARQGYWQERKKSWLAMGIASELGRGSATAYDLGGMDQSRGGHRSANNSKRTTWVAGDRPESTLDETSRKILSATRRSADAHSDATNAAQLLALADNGTEYIAPGTSIFDPVLCELVYRWFSPAGGTVLDPFAGGSVRGIVAAQLGRQYVGIDIRAEQVAANEMQRGILPDTVPAPVWYCGDSTHIATIAPDLRSDLVFSCPPYGDLEVYSEDPRDLSTMAHSDFIASYRAIIAAAVATLRPDRFAVFVVGDYRDEAGFYRNFVSDTIAAFESAGAMLYNEAILVTALGSLPIRTARAFNSRRKLGKTHQNVLVFFKGNPASIHGVLGDCDFAAVDETPGDADA